MNISYNWLKQYVDFNLTPDEVAEALTSIGLETGAIEKVESIRGGLQGIVVGKVLTCIEHPDSDHLHITTVDLGDGQPTQIVRRSQRGSRSDRSGCHRRNHPLRRR